MPRVAGLGAIDLSAYATVAADSTAATPAPPRGAPVLDAPFPGAPLGPAGAVALRASPGTLATGSATAAAMMWRPTPYGLPRTVGLGVATIHRAADPRVSPLEVATTAFVPVSAAGSAGVVLDMNAKRFDEVLPERCVVGDAGHTRAFIGIDKRPGTPLDARLVAIVSGIPRRYDGQIDPEVAIEFVRTRVPELLRWTAGSAFNDGRPEFDWDREAGVSEASWSVFRAAVQQPVGDLPYLTGQSFPVVPMERFLDVGYGYCLQKALLGALILERARVPHRIVHGALSRGPGDSGGHSWLELADGRVLDPAWALVTRPQSEGAPAPGLERVGDSWRYSCATFPYLSVTESPTQT